MGSSCWIAVPEDGWCSLVVTSRTTDAGWRRLELRGEWWQRTSLMVFTLRHWHNITLSSSSSAKANNSSWIIIPHVVFINRICLLICLLRLWRAKTSVCAGFGVIGTSCGMPPTFFRHTKVMSKSPPQKKIPYPLKKLWLATWLWLCAAMTMTIRIVLNNVIVIVSPDWRPPALQIHSTRLSVTVRDTNCIVSRHIVRW